MKKQISFLFILLLSGFIFVNSSMAADLVTKLKGKILLQIEENGEAWYINPADEKRYFLGKPDDAFNLMKELGIGITNIDLEKIQIADANLSGEDSDSDGLSDMIEDSLGTNKNSTDTDGDGYNDKDEILNGYDPDGTEKLNSDSDFATDQNGKILLQVEQHGEAWYVNPDDNKRYFLGRANDAFNLMRSLGLGISNDNLNQIEESETINISQNSSDVECALFADNLDSCTAYSCSFTHPFGGVLMQKEIMGLQNDKCQYTEEMPNDGRMDCEYTGDMRKAIAQYYRDLATAEFFGTETSVDLSDGETEIKYTIDGKEVENPLQEAMDNGQCIISGYDEPINDEPINEDSCPAGETYISEISIYPEGEKTTYIECSDSTMFCSACENCDSGTALRLINEGEEMCKECLSNFNSNCKEGFSCEDGICN